MVLCYPSGFQVAGFGFLGFGGFFFFPEEKWKLSVKERSEPCFGEAREQQRQRVCHLYEAVLCYRKMH